MEEVWLNHFLARVVGNKPKWTRETVAARLAEINTKGEELKQLLDQIKEQQSVLSTAATATANKSHTDSLLKSATELKGIIESLMVPLKDPSFEKYRQRILKTHRKKKWNKKKKDILKKRKQEIVNEKKLITKVVDEWSQQKDQEAAEHKKLELMKQEEMKRLFEKRMQKAKYANKLRVLLKLEKLRTSRRELLEHQGYNVQAAVPLEDLIKEAHKQAIAEKQALQMAKSREQQKQLETFSKNISESFYDAEEASTEEPTAVQRTGQPLGAREQVEKFYYQAFDNLENLINIRRNWDNYVVPQGTGGSRVPQHYPESVLGAGSLLWRNYLVSTKK